MRNDGWLCRNDLETRKKIDHRKKNSTKIHKLRVARCHKPACASASFASAAADNTESMAEAAAAVTAAPAAVRVPTVGHPTTAAAAVPADSIAGTASVLVAASQSNFGPIAWHFVARRSANARCTNAVVRPTQCHCSDR